MKKLSLLLADAAALASMLPFETQQGIMSHVKDAIEENHPQILFNVLATMQAAIPDDMPPIVYEVGDECQLDGKPVVMCEVRYTATSPSRLYVQTFDGHDGEKGSYTLEELYHGDDASRREHLKKRLAMLATFLSDGKILEMTAGERMWCHFTSGFLNSGEPLRQTLDEAESTFDSLWERREV